MEVLNNMQEVKLEIKNLNKAIDQKVILNDISFEVYDGERTFERLINETTADTLHFIPDTYWMQVGGVTPADFIKKLKGRAEVCHFKDMRIVNNEQRFAECGTGNIDLGACYRACKEIGVKYIVIEQDLCYDMDVFDSVRIGFEGLKRIAKENE